MKFYETQRLGSKQAMTPEGFLICKDVPIARTGIQLYAAPELPTYEAGRDGIIQALRREEDVFRPETAASFEGKSVTDDHPLEDVNPENWRQLAVGHVQNVRRGQGVDADYLLGDMIIKDAAAIAAVRAGKREVSCGYDADYEQLEPGKVRQFNIVGNHVALVEQGRCGHQCSIGDAAMRTNDKRSSVWDRIRTAFKDKDEEKLEEAMEEAKKAKDALDGGDDEEEPGKVNVHVHPPATEDMKKVRDSLDALTKAVTDGAKRMDAMEEKIAKMAPGAGTNGGGDLETKDDDLGDISGDDPEAKATGDSLELVKSFKQVFALAEVLAPGVKMPTFDAKLKPAAIRDGICLFKRRVLAQAYRASDEGREVVAPFLDGAKDFTSKSMTCDAVSAAFLGAATLMKRQNNQATSGDGSLVINGRTVDFQAKAPPSIAEINERNKKFYT